MEAEQADGRKWFSTVANDWYELQAKTKSVERMKDYRVHLEGRVNPAIGRKHVGNLTPGDLDELVATLVSDRGLASSTVKQTMSTVKQVLSYAVRNKLINASPYVDIVIPKTPPLEERALTRSEIDTLSKVIPDSQRDKFLTLLFTGMRKGELQGLHWDAVDFERGTIRVFRSYSNYGKRFKPTKGWETRTVPMNEAVLGIMRRLRDMGDYPGVPVPDIPYDDMQVPRAGLVFPGERGGPFYGEVLLRELKTGARYAGIEGNIRLHDLRHTYATWLAESGIPLQDIQKLLGHESITTTERYARYQVKDFTDITNVLERGTPEEVASVAPGVWEGLPIGPDGEVAGPDEPDEDWHADYLRYGPDDAGPDAPD